MRSYRQLLIFAGFSLAVVAGGIARHQVSFWRDTGTLMRRALAVTERNYKAHDNLGAQALKAGRYEEMVDHFREGMRARRALGMIPTER